METLKLEDVMATIDELLAAGKKPAMWERLNHLAGDALMTKQMEALENVAKGLLEYANSNGISKELWQAATKEAALMTDYEYRYIHQGLMHVAIKNVREQQRAIVKNEFEAIGEVVEHEGYISNNILTKARNFKMFSTWIKKHRQAGISPMRPGKWNSTDKQMDYMAERLGVDLKTNADNHTAVRMFLEDYNLRKQDKPNINTKLAVKNGEVILTYD